MNSDLILLKIEHDTDLQTWRVDWTTNENRSA
jgi:hypothetical protein